jgi:TonB family protein
MNSRSRTFVARALPLAAAVLLVHAHDAAAQRGGNVAQRLAVLLSDRPMPRSNCRIESRPNPLPAVNAIVDSAALDGKLRELAVAEHFDHGADMRVLVSLGWDPHGVSTRARPFDWYVPHGVGEQIGAMVRSTVRPQRGGMNVRLRIDFADGKPTFRVGRSEVCQPQGLERINIMAPAVEQIEAPHDVRVRVTVGPGGNLIGAQITSSSGKRYWDDEVMRMVNESSFNAGIIDEGEEIMEYEATIHFRAR